MQDEVLSHRLGLIPLKVDPRKLVFPRKSSEIRIRRG
jgi:DNA-directed RNA polymerase alpha subunit